MAALSFFLRPRERGSVLALSLIASLILFALTAPFLVRLSGGYRATERGFVGMAALNLAEAGVERAIWELNKGDIATWSGTLLERHLTLTSIATNDGKTVGDVDIVVTNPASDNPVVGTTGRVAWIGGRTVSRSLRVVLKHGFKSHFDFGIFGDEGFDLHGDAYTDSYNSQVGLYDPLHPNDRGDVGTNADQRWDVALLNNTRVNGNAISGFQSDPEVVIRLANNAMITGTKSALETPKLLPVYPPPLLTDRGALSIPTGSYDTLITASGKYTSLSLAANSKVTISGKVTLFVDGNFTMNSNTTIDILPGSEVEIILGNGTFTQQSNTQINNLTMDPHNLAILGTASFHNMNWQSNSALYGVVYVPEANVDYAANSDLFGSIVCNYIHMSSNAGIHYDESLGVWEKYGTYTGDYVVKSWQEII